MRAGLFVAGKYTLQEQIGKGGMGSVWLARNELIERDFAIKLLHPEAARDHKVRERFFREARIPGRLRHPNILEVFDVGTAPELDGSPFLVMELLDGVPLDTAIRALGVLPIRLALLVGAAIGRALESAHANGVLHRDLKPANVFLHRTPTGHLVPKLVDFGISKIADEEHPEDPDLALTRAGTILGSPLYMSPEQAAGDRNLDGRSDLHALGVLLYWCIAGRSPFVSRRFETLLAELVNPARPRLLDVRGDVPPGVSALVSKAFATSRVDRFQTATELVAALEAELSALGPGPSLDSRASVQELFERLRAAGVSVADRSTTTTRSPLARSLPPPPPALVGSALAFAASAEKGAASVPPASRARSVLAVALGIAAFASMAVVGGVGVHLRDGRTRAATAIAAANMAPIEGAATQARPSLHVPPEPPAVPSAESAPAEHTDPVAPSPSATTARLTPAVVPGRYGPVPRPPQVGSADDALPQTRF